MEKFPQSTYRLQLHSRFTFDDALAAADYLKDLGISHAYCSPYLQAAPNSMHGYSVVDYEKVNEELGGEEGLQRFSARLKTLDMGQILDIVPNHMAIGPQNRYWWDVLENGPSSIYATWFDIEWHSAEVKLQNKVLLPVLGNQYGRVLAAGEIRVEQDRNNFLISYFDNLFPVAPRSLAIPLARAAELAESDSLSFIADSLTRLPAPDSTDRDEVALRHRDKKVIYDLLRTLCDLDQNITETISQVIVDLNQDIDALDAFLNQQNYRLAYWRTADQELGYRRFFDINTLVGLRIEREHVFDATHSRALKWLDKGVLDGLRVDHPDGLRDPRQYFQRLRGHAPNAWIVSEKILQPGENLRSDWPIEGTTGYDFLNVCNRVLVHDEGLKELTDIYERFTGEPVDFAVIAREKRLMIEHEALGSDVNRLANLFVAICENNRDRRDYTRAEIRRALREVAAGFSVYRTYVAPERNQITDEDRAEIDEAIRLAKLHRTDLDPELLNFMGDVLAMRARGAMETEFLLRFQQFTAPVAAKGLEDTASYCYNRMIGFNEVGGSPDCGGLTLKEFHDFFIERQASYPFTMNTLSTHDTKRCEDVRARLAVLTEIPRRWRSALNHWARLNAKFKTASLPDRNTEYLLYQTMIGAWPIDAERLNAYMEKATREAKQHTSWTQQNREFEGALTSFVNGILQSQPFIEELEAFVQYVLEAGRMNSLSQTLVRCTAPGVPDIYQGSELWDLRLVDPDNRGPVDYETRRRMLAQIESGIQPAEIFQNMDSGMPKLWTIFKALGLRREHPEWFGVDAGYVPIYAQGSKDRQVIAYLRGDSVVTVAPRWNVGHGAGWASTTIDLPSGRWRNLLDGSTLEGGRVRMQKLLNDFPVALLAREMD